MATPRVAPTLVSSSDLATAIDRYFEVSARRYQEQLLRVLAKLGEPSTRVANDPARALRIVGFCVETLAGFARGAAIDPLAQLLRRHTDDAGKTAIRALVATGIAATMPTAPTATTLVAVPRMIADADRRPLVDDFGTRLNIRIATDLADLRAIGRKLVGAATFAIPEATVAAIAALADADDSAALRFGDQVGYGWGTCMAALARAKTAPMLAHARSRELWSRWWRYVRGEHVVAATEYRVGAERSALTPDEGFMQIG